MDEEADRKDFNTIDIDQEAEEFFKFLRHDMSKEDWVAYTGAFNELKEEWIMRECPWGGDGSYTEILELIKFKIERMLDYLELFGQSSNGPMVVSTMRTTCRLIDIVLNYGNENKGCDVFPHRVNMRNAHRFPKLQEIGDPYDHGEKQKVRYNKAYCLLLGF